MTLSPCTDSGTRARKFLDQLDEELGKPTGADRREQMQTLPAEATALQVST